MFKLIVIFLLVTLTHVRCSEGGKNICQMEQSFIELEAKNTTQPVRIRSYDWCFSFPPRCSNYRTEIRDVIKVQNVTKTKFIDHCCEGFNNINSNSNETIVCSPVCRGGCGHGICESPNTCICEVGYEGRHCTQRCRTKWYGNNCKNVCKCRNNSLCDHKTGFCRCASGWIGEFCERPCPKGQYGMMCHKKCTCNGSNCDPYSGECLAENAKIVFDVTHNRSSGITKLTSYRIKAKHWIPVNGNGKINFRNCSDPDDQCEPNDGKIAVDRNDINATALIQELNANLTDLTKELKAATDKSVVIVNSSNTSVAIHHIHKGVKTGASGKKSKFDDLYSDEASTELNFIETQNQDQVYNQHGEFEGVDGHAGLDYSDEIDTIGGYNHVVHVFATSSINTTKSEQIVTLPPMVPATLILLVVMIAVVVIFFVAFYFIRKSKTSQTQTDICSTDDITLSDQIVQKPLPEIPSSFAQSITRRIMQQDFYDRPSNNKSVKNGLNKLGYCYANDENNRHADGSSACDEHIYDEIKYSNYCETTRR